VVIKENETAWVTILWMLVCPRALMQWQASSFTFIKDQLNVTLTIWLGKEQCATWCVGLDHLHNVFKELDNPVHALG
jgi:hypothetical protein